MPKVLKSTCRKLYVYLHGKNQLQSHCFFEILQRHCKVAILVPFGMLAHPHQKSYYQFVGNFHAYLLAKNQLHTHFFLKILQGNSKLVILGNLGMSGQFEETFDVYQQAKNLLHPSFFP